MAADILITGANRGLGLALAEQLLEMGHRLFTFNRRECPESRALKERYPDTLHPYDVDVTDESCIRASVGLIGERFCSLDIVINNAAVDLDQDSPPLEQADFSVYLPSFQANSIGPLMVLKYALPLLRKGEKKLVVNVSSEAGSIGSCWRKGEYSYCMTKAALNMGSRILQNAVREDGIKVLALHPGWFSSDMGGGDAPITPAQAAQAIIQVLIDPPALDGPMYVDLYGEELEW